MESADGLGGCHSLGLGRPHGWIVVVGSASRLACSCRSVFRVIQLCSRIDVNYSRCATSALSIYSKVRSISAWKLLVAGWRLHLAVQTGAGTLGGRVFELHLLLEFVVVGVVLK